VLVLLHYYTKGIIMLQIKKQLGKVRYIAAVGLATLAVAAGITSVAPAKSASAVTCRVFTPATNLYEGGQVTSRNTHHVPGKGVSGCVDINVRNIKNNNVAGDYCGTFRVQFFPTSGGSYYNSPKFVCSKDPDGAGPANGPVIPIATNVLNGTEYRVWHNVENQGWTHTYQLVD
jgi:hypothetical protein